MGRDLADWERNVLNERQADARPSKEEIERERKRAEELHAELKATLGFIEAVGEPEHIDVAMAVAEHCGFDRLQAELDVVVDRPHHGRNRFGNLVERHQEPHEIPDPEEFDRQVPARAYRPGFPVTERVRELKAEAWLELPEPDYIRVKREKRTAGGAVRYEVKIEKEPTAGDHQ